LIAEACANGAGRRKACELLGISLRTIERWARPDGQADKRPTSSRPWQPKQLTDEEKEMIIATANEEQFRDLPPCKIVPLLANAGRYIASESSFYRVLRENKQLTHRSRSKPAAHHKPEAYEASNSNEVWSWDISYLPTTVSGLYFYLYMVIDIFSRKIVGWSIHEKQSADLGAALIKQACLDEGVEENQLVLHSDNGKPMKGATMLAMLEKLGVIPSFSRPSVSDDNPYSESLFKTVKYHPTFPVAKKFDTIQEARVWTEKFVTWYNTEHLHSGLKFVTPEQRHTGEDQLILNKRHEVYQQAKQNRPERWSGNTRNWALPETVTLNPNKSNKINSHVRQELNVA
jgi:putative transposase